MGTTTVGVLLFDEPGPQNTDQALTAGLVRAETLGLRHAVVATDTGKTAGRLLRLAAGRVRVVAVTNPAGLAVPLERLHDYLPRFRAHRDSIAARGLRKIPASLSEDERRRLLEAGAAAVLRVDWRAVGGYLRTDLRALDRVGVGVRVALVVSIVARLAGEIPPGEELLAFAGTGFGGGGADTAIVARAAETWADWRVPEILARPRFAPPSETA
jgi:hypothetical protein